MFKYVFFSESIGGSAGVCQRLPTEPAIYAIFREVKLPKKEAPADEFVKAVISIIEAKAAPTKKNKVGPLHQIELDSCSELSQNKTDQLSNLADCEVFRANLGAVLEKASLLQAPLYVGKADSLQSRIKQHLEPNSDLALRFREAGINIRSCILAYTVISREILKLDDKSLFLVEEIISRICRPGFVSRIG